MAYNPEFYRGHREQAAELARALWSGQSTVEQYRTHELARLTWDTLAEAPKVKVPTLVLCGADDGVERRGSTPEATARRLAPLIPGAELALVPGVRHMTFWDGDGALKTVQDFMARHPMGAKLDSYNSVHHEGTKDTEVSEINPSNFVRFVFFVVRSFLGELRRH